MVAIRRLSSMVHLCCTLSLLQQLLSLFASSSAGTGLTFLPPAIDYDLLSSTLWRCHHSLERSVLLELLRPAKSGEEEGEGEEHKENGPSAVEIIHFKKEWVELVSEMTSEEQLRSLGLHPCTRVAHMRDLVATELRESVEAGLWEDRAMAAYDNDDVRGGDTGVKEGRKRERILRSIKRDANQRYLFDHYLDLPSMKSWYEDLASSHPTLITLHPSIGKTLYHRDIFALHMTHKPSLAPGQSRPVIYIQCLLHSREWISGPVCMYITQQLVDNSLFSNLLRKIEVVVVPIANPDGYYVTWLNYPKYRLWRKNVSPTQGSKCAGVDLNRNFDTHWNGDASSESDDPCSETYRGPSANSELEVQAIATHLRGLASSLIGAIDYHSYYQEVLYPPAWSDVVPEGMVTIERVAKSVARVASSVGMPYTTHRMVDIYSATGTWADWMMDLRGSGGCADTVPLTIELRPSSFSHPLNVSQGFFLPKSQIYPTCTEMLMAFTEFVGLVLDTGKNCYQEKP